jgi:ATP-dependent Zn protease
LFDNNYFVVFSTVDKGSGIDHFEIKETYTGLDGHFVVGSSPYVLKDQSLNKNIYIKAVDKNGNIRLSKINAQNHLVIFIIYVFVGIIILLCFMLIQKKYLRF